MFVDLELGPRNLALVIYIPRGSPSKVSAAEWRLGALNIHTAPRYKRGSRHSDYALPSYTGPEHQNEAK